MQRSSKLSFAEVYEIIIIMFSYTVHVIVLFLSETVVDAIGKDCVEKWFSKYSNFKMQACSFQTLSRDLSQSLCCVS